MAATYHAHGPHASQPQAPHFTDIGAACHDILSAHQRPLTINMQASQNPASHARLKTYIVHSDAPP
eukprot:8795032-Pyramimonas_sp.AAC.1